MPSLCVQIAGATFALNLPDHPASHELCRAWDSFRIAESGAATPIEVRFDRKPGAGPLTLPEVRGGEGAELVVRGDHFDAHSPVDRTRATLSASPTRFPVETLVKILLGDRLLQKGGLLVHGVSLATNGSAALFCGPSGAGKSTLGQHGQKGGLTLLADELVAVVPTEEGYAVHGTPWNLGAPLTARLRIVGTLAWSSAPELKATGPSEILKTLLPNSLMPDQSPEGRARMFKASSALLGRVGCACLHFAPHESVGPVLAQALAAVK